MSHIVAFYEGDPVKKVIDRHQVSPREVGKVVIWITRASTQNRIEGLCRRAGLESRVVGGLDRRDELSGRQIWDWVRAETNRGDDESAVKECCKDERILERDSLVVETTMWEIR